MAERSASNATAALAIMAVIGLSSALAQAQDLDRDGDGVLDAEDDCPTLAATNVYGSEGCPPTPRPNAGVRTGEPARLESDSPYWTPATYGDKGWDDDAPGPAMRNVGIALTVASLVVGTVGTAIGWHLSESGGNDERITGFLVGIGTGGLAGSLLLTGVTLWVVGAVRYEDPSASRAAHDRSTPSWRGSASVRGAF